MKRNTFENLPETPGPCIHCGLGIAMHAQDHNRPTVFHCPPQPTTKQWFTCIIVVKDHLASYLHTRAETPAEAEENGMRWALDGEADRTTDDVDIPFVFEGKLEPVN